MAEPTEKDFTEVAKEALGGDVAGTVSALVAAAVGSTTGHPLAAVLAAKLTNVVTTAVTTTNTTRFLQRGGEVDAQRAAETQFRRLLSLAVEPLFDELGNEHGEEIAQLRRYLERNLASAEGQGELLRGRDRLLDGQRQILQKQDEILHALDISMRGPKGKRDASFTGRGEQLYKAAIRTDFRFDSRQDVLIHGYYGTNRVSATTIKVDGFTLSQERGDLLGHGVYFWTDPALAWYWAHKYHGQFATVLRATLLLGYCLDLDNVSQYANLIRSTYKRLEAEFRRMQKSMPQDLEDDPRLACLLYNHVCMSTVPQVDSLTVSEDAPGSQLKDTSHKQVCMRNLQNIHYPECIQEGSQ